MSQPISEGIKPSHMDSKEKNLAPHEVAVFDADNEKNVHAGGSGSNGSPMDKDLDLLEHSEKIDLSQVDPAVLKRVLRKIDLVLMPVMMLCEFFQFLDKSSISYAKLFDIEKATGMHGQQFAWLGSIFYIGYLFWQPFAAFLLVRIPVRMHLTIIVCLWGVILGCMAASKNFASLAALRFLLGMAESAMIPILGTITGMFYTREEQATRVGIWFGSVGPSQIFGGLIAYGMYSLKSSVIQQWQFIFVLLGPVTFAFGVYIAIVIPTSPATAWFLSPQERLIALERIRSNKTGTATTHFKKGQVIQAFRDPRIYLAALSVLCASIPNGGISSFGATIIAGFGFDTKETTLVGMSTGASETVAMAVAVILSRKMKMRVLPAIICIGVAIVGAAMMVGSHNRNAQLGGYCLVFWWATGQMLFIPLMQSMVAGHTKRSMFYALYQIGYSAGNVVGAQIYRAKDAPGYIPAKITILVTIALHAATLGAIALLHRYWNAQNAKRVEHVIEEENIEFKE
ncbi:hypothetical protein I302_105490 [Kwoniella bestiolae CBS 10118]|uniref:Major facilitator superfamily (MFS) profile domain-containing protein n=1 Tax=Kwoniella bestiolae CBS 10118 TaxID=1296100 RepID=A0A1B9FTA1_9TREE|nr:hypothetical protein I302_08772 [Kwoniella bestiolae CBS 10118]OCF21991.1 hypothetical protein I302_08772 [Kwoniella bestiolae CBS 10118]